MRYISLFEKNAPMLSNVFNSPLELKKMVNFFLSNLRDSGKMMLDSSETEEIKEEPGIRQALQSYMTHYIEPAMAFELHGDATDKNSNEFKIFEHMIINRGDKSKTKNDLQNIIKNNSSYSKVYDEAETAYNYLTSNYMLYKKQY